MAASSLVYEDLARSFRAHSGAYVSETIAERCRCGAAAAGVLLVRQAPRDSSGSVALQLVDVDVCVVLLQIQRWS